MSTSIEKKRVAKIFLDGEVKSRLEVIEKTLLERDAKDVSLGQIVEKLIISIDQKTIESIIDELTPFEFRLKSALQDERKRKQIMKILTGKNDLETSRLLVEDTHS